MAAKLPLRVVVDSPARAIDPPEAQRLTHRLRPREALAAGVTLVESDEKLDCAVVIGLEPLTEFRGARKVDRRRINPVA